MSRLTNVDYGDGQTQSYTFDAMGNRLSRQDSASGTTNSTTYACNAANMLLSTSGAGASGFQNDADGNTLSNTPVAGGGRTNTWDSQNRLASCATSSATTTYTYGADGLRRRAFKFQPIKRGPATQDITPELDTAMDLGTSYAYDGTMLVREGHAQSANGTSSLQPSSVTATYFIGARGPEYRRDDTQTEVDSQGRTVTKARWYVFDGLGSVVGEVDPLGNLTSSPKYDVYGAVRSNPGTATSKQGFVGGLGHVSDDTGLVYMRARYYDPNLGRFISEDPARNGENWLIYCKDNPTNSVDQDGKDDAGVLCEEIAAFMLATLTCRMFQVSLAGLFLATLACILAPLAFVVGCAIPFGGLASGAAGAIMTVQAISGMMAALKASPGWGGVGMIVAKGSVLGPVYEVCAFFGGYASGLYLTMEADDAYQELT